MGEKINEEKKQESSKKREEVLEIVRLLEIYKEMKEKSTDLNYLLAIATTRLAGYQDENPTLVLSFLKTEQIPEKIEALIGEMVDLFHQERRESKKSLALVKEGGSWEDELKSWEEKIAKINRDISKLIPSVDFDKASPFNGPLVPLGYNLWYDQSRGIYASLMIRILFLKPKVGTIWAKEDTSEKNFEKARLEPPTVKITGGRKRYYENAENTAMFIKTHNKNVLTFKAYFKKEGYKVL